MTRETVCVETPVIAAISLIVTLCWRCKLGRSSGESPVPGGFGIAAMW